MSLYNIKRNSHLHYGDHRSEMHCAVLACVHTMSSKISHWEYSGQPLLRP